MSHTTNFRRFALACGVCRRLLGALALVLAFLGVLRLVAAEKPKEKPKSIVCPPGQSCTTNAPKPDADPERRYACGRSDSYHACHCLQFVAEVQPKLLEECDQSGKSPAECLAIASACGIVQKADPKHPEHTCRRSCSKAKCFCHLDQEAHACEGPELITPTYGGSEQ